MAKSDVIQWHTHPHRSQINNNNNLKKNIHHARSSDQTKGIVLLTNAEFIWQRKVLHTRHPAHLRTRKYTPPPTILQALGGKRN